MTPTVSAEAVDLPSLLADIQRVPIGQISPDAASDVVQRVVRAESNRAIDVAMFTSAI